MMSQKKKTVSDKMKPEKIRQSRNTDMVSAEKDRSIAARVSEMAEPLCRAMGLELIHTEYQREAHGRILRLYIDKPGGVRVEDCAAVSRQLADLLEVGFEDIGPYHLEVSSPGIERPLGKMTDFEKYRGHRIKISISHAVEGKKKFQGILSSVSPDGLISLQIGENTVQIPFAEIIRARLVSQREEKGC